MANNKSREDLNFIRPMPSYTPQLLYNNHEHYDLTSFDINKDEIEKKNKDIIDSQQKNTDGLKNISFNDYYLTNYITMNNNSNLDKQQYEENKPNMQNNVYPFTIRNPTDAKYDCEKKERLTDINLFKQVQGGNIIHYSDNKPIPTRVNSYKTDNNNQLPMALPSNCAYPINKK